MKADVDLIKQKISDADLEEAFKILTSSLTNTEDETTVIILKQRYMRLEKDKKLGVLEDDDYTREMGKITLSLLDLLHSVKLNFVEKEMSFEPKLKFFEHKLNDPYPPFNERVYAESFEKEKTAGIGWELHSSFTSTNFPITLGMSWRLQKSDGTYTQDYPSDVHIDKGWSSLWLTRAWGYKDNGKLPIGTYTFEVAVSENITIKSSFTIV